MDELNDRFALVTDPEGRAAVLDEMAYAAHRRREVSDENLVDMLELSEAGKEWGLVEVDEAYHIACSVTRLRIVGMVTSQDGSS